MFEITDSTIRAYKMKNSKKCFHLKTYLLINTNMKFCFPHYLKDISATLDIADIGLIESRDIDMTMDTEFHTDHLMVHKLWITFITDYDKPFYGNLGKLKINIKVSINGFLEDKPETIEKMVVIECRRTQFGY